MIRMTEKRFKCVSDYDWWGVIDNTGEIKGMFDSDCFTTDKVVDLLNNYEDENQQLKIDNELFFKKVFNILLKYQHLFNREMADEVLEELGIELTGWFE